MHLPCLRVLPGLIDNAFKLELAGISLLENVNAFIGLAQDIIVSHACNRKYITELCIL